MRIAIFILIILTYSLNSYSQNDTIYLQDNCVIFQNNEYNKYSDSLKSGLWIDYEIDDPYIEIENGSGEKYHTEIATYSEFRSLKKNEYCGMKVKIKESTHYYDGDEYYSCTYNRITNKIPPDCYNLLAIGEYRNNLKIKEWTYYYRSKKVLKSIYYTEGLPSNDFKVFRENGSLMIEVIKTAPTCWEIKKYSEAGKILSCEYMEIDDFKLLY